MSWRQSCSIRRLVLKSGVQALSIRLEGWWQIQTYLHPALIVRSFQLWRPGPGDDISASRAHRSEVLWFLVLGSHWWTTLGRPGLVNVCMFKGFARNIYPPHSLFRWTKQIWCKFNASQNGPSSTVSQIPMKLSWEVACKGCNFGWSDDEVEVPR